MYATGLRAVDRVKVVELGRMDVTHVGIINSMRSHKIVAMCDSNPNLVKFASRLVRNIPL